MLDPVFPSSTAIEQIQYDPKSKTLLVTFHNRKGTYVFNGIPEETYFDFINAASVGEFYRKNILSK